MVLARVLVQHMMASITYLAGEVLLPCSWGLTRALLPDCLCLLTAWQLNSKNLFQDAEAETIDLVRSSLRIYAESFLPHSTDQGQAYLRPGTRGGKVDTTP